MVYPLQFAQGCNLYVYISKLTLSSLYLQPVICYGTAKCLIMFFQKTRNIHHLYWKNVYGSHIDTTVIFFATSYSHTILLSGKIW